ncbi:MAG: 30S ribosomal protein S18 [Nitrospinae bacterium]|nr:30S ribosomal protein S18 [Nitrospinota bacterium]
MMAAEKKKIIKKKVYTINKICRFCYDNRHKINYKDIKTLQNMVTERGKIIPRRISGNCASHQREVVTAIKRARNVAFLPYTVGR